MASPHRDHDPSRHAAWMVAASLCVACSGSNSGTTRPDASSPGDVSDLGALTDTPDVSVAVDASDASTPRDVPVAEDAMAPSDASLVGYTETRAPCRDRNPTRNAYFGDFHVHTALSFDAYVFDNRNDPAAAYRFAKGEAIRLPPLDANGQGTREARLDRPLDFAATTDHSEFLGEISLCTTPGSEAYNSVTCRAYRNGGDTIGFGIFGAQLARTDPMRYPFCGTGDTVCQTAAGRVWMSVRQAAETAYDRTASCRFTSFVAYEWTGTTAGSTLHRNVIFRNANVPDLPVTYIDQQTPLGLWTALQARCTRGGMGCQVLAIPHNSNLSNGRAFTLEYPTGASTDEQRRIASLRAELEPLVEMVQHKGASECNRAFSTNDEACGFENVNPTAPLCNGDGSGTGMNCTGRGDYVRNALGTGMREEARLGVNPLRYGFIASTDTHNSTPGNTSETTFPGHVGTQDDEPSEILGPSLAVFSPGGLVGVWAVENSRDAIFEALLRRETFATSGTRVRVRMFGGWNYPANLCNDPNVVARGYAEGVPQGSLLPMRPSVMGAAPRFALMATADMTPLQRVEVVKVWIDASGQPRERVVTVAGSAANGASVDTNTCATTPGMGQMSYCAVWTDDQYNPAERAAYYARVLENPTCRWSTLHCNRLPAAQRPAACMDGSIPRSIQERAWSSPVYYIP